MSKKGMMARGKRYYERIKGGLKVPKGVSEDHPDVKAYLDSLPKEEPKKKVTK